MSSFRQRSATAEKLAMFFLELGKIPTEAEFRQMSGVPVRMATVRTYYKNWARMQEVIKKLQPGIWAELHKPVVKKPVAKPAKVVVKDK